MSLSVVAADEKERLARRPVLGDSLVGQARQSAVELLRGLDGQPSRDPWSQPEAEGLGGVVDPVDVGLDQTARGLPVLPPVQPEEDALVPEGHVGEGRRYGPAAWRGARQVRVAQTLDQRAKAAELRGVLGHV